MTDVTISPSGQAPYLYKIVDIVGTTAFQLGQFVWAEQYHPENGAIFTFSDAQGRQLGCAVGRYMGCLN